MQAGANPSAISRKIMREPIGEGLRPAAEPCLKKIRRRQRLGGLLLSCATYAFLFTFTASAAIGSGPRPR